MKQPVDPIAFGRRVKEKRRELGLSQETLGKLSGYSQTNVQWAESGKMKRPHIQAQGLAEPLRTTIEWLMYGTGVRDVAAPPRTGTELAEIYDKLPLAAREAINAQVDAALAGLEKKRKTRAAG
jgi:transcriptional regulator with XRE-family HTH domain